MADFEAPSNDQMPETTTEPEISEKPAQANPTAKPNEPPPPDYMRDTLNESVGATLGRDFKLILLRTWQVIWIFNKSPNLEVYEEYDIFGPLFYMLVYSLCIQFTFSKANDTMMAILIAIIVVFSFIIGLNLLLLGGSVSIMGTVCLIGYSIAPLALGALVELILEACQIPSNWIFKLCMSLVSAFVCVWSLFATYGFFKNVSVKEKIFESIYPVFFLYIALAMFIIVASLD